MAWNEPGNNGRDPWSQGPGGKRPEVQVDLKDLARRLRGIFGNKGPRGPALLIGAGIVFAAWLLSGLYTVDEQEQAVVVRFGAYVGTTGPGLHWHWPAPIERKNKVNVTEVRQQSVQAELLTKDLNLVDINMTLQYRVSSAQAVRFNLRRTVEYTMGNAGISALQDVISGTTADDVLNLGRQSVIATSVQQQLQQLLDSYKCGLQVTGASIKAAPPDAVAAAFFDNWNANEEQTSRRNEAQGFAADRLPKAQAYRDQAIARAEGDTARFSALLQEYRKSPQITRTNMYIDAMREIYANSGKVLVDIDKGTANINLPLEQLLKSTPPAKAETKAEAEPSAPPQAAAPAPEASAPAPQAPHASPGPPPDGDDNTRSRDRESH